MTPEEEQEEQIEKAIQRVQSGELSPEEAAKSLLSEMRRVDSQEASPSEVTETLSQLIERLGSPPEDVLNVWCDQVENVSIALQAAGQRLPPIETDHWFLSDVGELQLFGFEIPDVEPRLVEERSVDTELLLLAKRNAASFRRQFESAAAERVESSEPRSTTQTLVAQDSNTDSGQDKSEMRRGPSDWRRTAVLRSLLVFAIGAIGALLWIASQEPSPKVAEKVGPRPIDDGITHRQGSGSPNTEPITHDSGSAESDVRSNQLETMQLETFESASYDAELSDAVSGEWLSLDAMMPKLPGGSDLTVAAASTAAEPSHLVPTKSSEDLGIENGSRDSDVTMLSPAGGKNLLTESDEGDEPDELPQMTRQDQETAIKLPAVDDFDSKVSLGATRFLSPRLEFPIPADVDLRGTKPPSDPNDSEKASGWNFVDRKTNEGIANIAFSGQQTEFQWTEAAKRSSVASLIAHGSLRDSTGRSVYMRPKVIADPYSISLDVPDSRPSWDLLAVLPPRVARLSLEFELPTPEKESDGIEVGWIEPIDSSSPRRTRALAVLKPTDGETIEIGVRFDIRCSRKLSARVRIFGRLDSSMSWQIISKPILENAAGQITTRAMRLSQLSTEVSAAYSRASASQRSSLRPKREAIEQESERVAEASKRIAELQSLVNRIESDVRVKFRLWVQWPELQQDLLVMDQAKDE